MSVERLIANYLVIAAEDLSAARLLASAGNRNAAYLAEQAAEKVIRAVLTSESVHGGISHALGQMVDLLPNENLWKSRLTRLTPLAAFATAYRYPTTARVPPAPPREVLVALLDEVDAALKLVAAHFQVDVSSVGAVAKRTAPPR